MRALDGYLSRTAQYRLRTDRDGPTVPALVYQEEDGTYTLEREGHPPLSLGEDFGRAKEALDALARAIGVFRG